MQTLERGFPRAEFAARTARAQTMLQERGLSALLLTTEPEIRFFTGFLTRFWESPARPWFLVVPASGKPIAVIPTIGAHLMAQTWIDDIRTWISPDYFDDGISLLEDTLSELGAELIGIPSGSETHLRMPLASFEKLKQSGSTFTNDQNVMRELRMVKSSLEIEKIETACSIASRAFARVHEILRPAKRFDELFRNFQILCLEEGADNVPYLAGGFGPLGYRDVISPAKPTRIGAGNIIMLDTGLTFDGYFCDFDRNFSMGPPADRSKDAYKILIEASEAAFSHARPGVRTSELFHIMDRILTGGHGEPTAGRLGHGLGMQLTEWPSLTPQDHTELCEGMVLTLEPWIDVSDGIGLVHEENIVITENGARMISPAAPSELPELLL